MHKLEIALNQTIKIMHWNENFSRELT